MLARTARSGPASVDEGDARRELALVGERQPPIDLHRSRGQPRPQHFLELAEPFLTQRVHAAVAVEVRVDQRKRPGIVERRSERIACRTSSMVVTFVAADVAEAGCCCWAAVQTIADTLNTTMRPVIRRVLRMVASTFCGYGPSSWLRNAVGPVLSDRPVTS